MNQQQFERLIVALVDLMSFSGKKLECVCKEGVNTPCKYCIAAKIISDVGIPSSAFISPSQRDL